MKNTDPFKVATLALRPTQFAVGMLEVDEKIAEVSKYRKNKLKAYVEENVVPVVRGPDGELYVVDKHHFLCVCFNLGIKKVRAKIAFDLHKQKMTYRGFWKWMGKNRSSYPYCQFGEGPRNELYLPRDIRGVADDPYRSLAWYVRKSGAFENSDKNFAEFKWANFFRSRKILDQDGRGGWEKALLKAVKLAQSPAAKRLPGYDKLNLTQTKEVLSEAKSKAKAIEKRM